MKLLIAMPVGSEWIIFFLVLAGAIFWIKTIIDIVRTKFRDDTTKIVWMLIVIFLGFIGALIYTIFGRYKKYEAP